MSDLEGKRAYFKDFDVSKSQDYRELTEYMEYALDEIMCLIQALGIPKSREEMRQLLKQLNHKEITLRDYYMALNL